MWAFRDSSSGRRLSHTLQARISVSNSCTQMLPIGLNHRFCQRVVVPVALMQKSGLFGDITAQRPTSDSQHLMSRVEVDEDPTPKNKVAVQPQFAYSRALQLTFVSCRHLRTSKDYFRSTVFCRSLTQSLVGLNKNSREQRVLLPHSLNLLAGMKKRGSNGPRGQISCYVGGWSRIWGCRSPWLSLRLTPSIG